MYFRNLIVLLVAVMIPALAGAKLSEQSRRGAWLASTEAESALTLVRPGQRADIVLSPSAHSAVRQAALFLAADIEKMTGQKPAIVTQATPGKPSIRLVTLGEGAIHPSIAAEHLGGQWESFRIQTTEDAVWLIGSNPRGTAFASYTLSEHLGIDPLYHWTGYTPAKQATLALKPIKFDSGEPTFKYRGLFHDDEDILPRPLDDNGYPQYAGGAVDPVWYERFFETALRLRMNQVAPFVRVVRPLAVRQMASDWGLMYTSHHYDILLSNPFGYERFGLAQQRAVSGDYDWSSNQDGIRKYWRAGVEAHKHLDAIWPVGLRGTADTAYQFPEGTTQAQKNQVFVQAIRDQVEMARSVVPRDKPPVFHFTLYGEMLKSFQSGQFDFPEDVILVWNDTGDGVMRALPEKLGKWKHGVYYHLAYYGATTKQTHHTIRPDRIEDEFRKIVESGATEYLLLNLSEMREHVMNARFIADVVWDAPAAFSRPDAAGRFVDWWSREYFGEQAAADAVDAYGAYFDILHSFDQILQGARSLDHALNRFAFRLRGDHHMHYTQNDLDLLAEMQARLKRYDEAFESVRTARSKMSAEQSQFFFDQLELGLLFDYYPTKAAALINAGFRKYPDEEALANVELALAELQQLEQAIRQAERPPFEGWYRPTWIRRKDSRTNPHYSYQRVMDYLEGYTPRYK
ncbi:MAG: glycosyl hydrolase 115 family protein [Pseudomonadales bacterium]